MAKIRKSTKRTAETGSVPGWTRGPDSGRECRRNTRLIRSNAQFWPTPYHPSINRDSNRFIKRASFRSIHALFNCSDQKNSQTTTVIFCRARTQFEKSSWQRSSTDHSAYFHLQLPHKCDKIFLLLLLPNRCCKRLSNSSSLPSTNVRSSVIDRLCAEGLARGVKLLYKRLTQSLDDDCCNKVDALLLPREGLRTVVITWLRQPPGEPKGQKSAYASR